MHPLKAFEFTLRHGLEDAQAADCRSLGLLLTEFNASEEAVNAAILSYSASADRSLRSVIRKQFGDRILRTIDVFNDTTGKGIKHLQEEDSEESAKIRRDVYMLKAADFLLTLRIWKERSETEGVYAAFAQEKHGAEVALSEVLRGIKLIEKFMPSTSILPALRQTWREVHDLVSKTQKTEVKTTVLREMFTA